jgi:hypothetical protein
MGFEMETGLCCRLYEGVLSVVSKVCDYVIPVVDQAFTPATTYLDTRCTLSNSSDCKRQPSKRHILADSGTDRMSQ